MKNHRSWHALTRPSGEGDCRPNALIGPLIEECLVSELCMAFAKEKYKQSTISLKKTDLVYDLSEKI
jgi:hypothetical protein